MTRLLPIQILDFEHWPERDRNAWKQALRPGGPLDDPGALYRHPAHRLRVLRAAYGRWLGYLVALGDGIVATGLDRLLREDLAGYLDQLSVSLAPCTVRAYMTDLLTVARALCANRAFPDLHAATRHVWRTAVPVNDKRSRLRSPEELFELGLALMDGAPKRSRVRALSAYRDGLIIALLAMRPVRLSNLACIEIDRHLKRYGERYWLIFTASEVKNRRPLEFPLPAELTARIDHYLNVIRPALLEQSGRWKRKAADALWASSHGGSLRAGRIKEIVPKRIAARFGTPMNVHLFRDAAATFIATVDPVHVGIITTILGHNSALTAERYYNQATSLTAARRLEAVWLPYRSQLSEA